MQVYREFYPVNEEYITLECVWNSDKFELLERSHMSEKKSKEGDWENDLPIRDSAVRYQSIESFLGGKNVRYSLTHCVPVLCFIRLLPC